MAGWVSLASRRRMARRRDPTRMRPTMLKLSVTAVLVGCLLAGCVVSRQARLYDLQSAEILNATYRYSGTGRGRIWLGESQESATCSGEYVTVPAGAESWGAIYSEGTATTVAASTTSSDQRGRAILTCEDGRLIECEYVTSSLSGAGSGTCLGNDSRRYRLMF